jgi:U32 family peptidase
LDVYPQPPATLKAEGWKLTAVRKPEIMSPAGYWPQLRAAIEAGADSVYFGLKHFTARAKVGFSLAELPEAMATLHRRGVKGFVTFNTLVFDHELDEAARALAEIAEAGADAIIVQDLGVLRMARRIAPGLEIHGSTQMSITSADGVKLAQRLGASRVTLARELSLDEVRAIRAATDCELEIFVHGALCVAYSGQCFSSEAWGGRSANRGQCAQACRLPYEMLVDGQAAPLGDARYLLSPGDLFALRQIPEIVEIGISALKIEGRYKDAEYVALTTRAYREAVDAACAGRPLAVDPARELQLEQVYSRGLGSHFLNGTNHQAVVNGRAPRHRGVLMGRVARVAGAAVIVEPAGAHAIAPLKPGDGVVFDAADWRSPEEPEEGGRVFQVTPLGGQVTPRGGASELRGGQPDPRGGQADPRGRGIELRGGQVDPRGGAIELRFANGAVNPARIRPGDLVWRTHDPEIEKAARPFTAPAAPVRKQRADVRVTAREGQPLETEWRVGPVAVEVRSHSPLGAARNSSLDAQLLREQFGRLGNTPYELGEIELRVTGAPFAPSSLLNQVRRQAVEELQQRQSTGAATIPPARLPDRSGGEVYAQRATARPAAGAPPALHLGPPTLHLLVRDGAQLAAALAARPAGITLDYLDLYGLRPSIERVRQSGIEVRVASPRVLKPGEERIVDFLLGCDCPILVRSTGLLEALRGAPSGPGPHELTGDFSLNAANALTAGELLDMGLARLTPTHDLNAAQVAELARRIGGGAIEAVAYQHLPVFHTEHCVFCRFLSKGTSYKDCGRPCEEHRVALRDTAGRAHPVVADVGCRNTVFGAEAQEASQHLETWREAGIHRFRLEFAHESADQVTRVARAFEETLSGRRTPRELAQTLERATPQGTTQGSLYVPEGYLTLPVLQ